VFCKIVCPHCNVQSAVGCIQARNNRRPSYRTWRPMQIIHLVAYNIAECFSSQPSYMRRFVLLPIERTQVKQTCDKCTDISTEKSLHFQSTSADNTDNPLFDPPLLNMSLQRRFKSQFHRIFKPRNSSAKVDRSIGTNRYQYIPVPIGTNRYQ
jgi:hypothetical protein